MFVAEAKFRKQSAEYTQLIQRQDEAAILELLTDRAVELKVGGWVGGGWVVGVAGRRQAGGQAKMRFSSRMCWCVWQPWAWLIYQRGEPSCLPSCSPAGD
jgi:hypothetical protein